MDVNKLLDIAVDAACKAGDFLRERTNLSVESSEGKDIKLAADKLSESIIIDVLSSTGIPILTEESGYLGDKADKFWIIDPLDGSMNYYKGLTDYACVSIALWENDEPVLGVINRFSNNEIFTGIKDGKAMLNNKIINTSGIKDIQNAVMATGFPVKRDYSDEGLLNFFNQVRRFKKVRMLGSAALMAVYVACGRVDAYFEEGIMLWDVAAALAIIKAAGGEVSCKELGDNRCVVSCFSTSRLMEDFNA